MISHYGKPHTLIIAVTGTLLLIAGLVLQWWAAAVAIGVVTLVLLAFFRDPDRQIPTVRGQIVSPADGRVRSLHRLEHFEPFDGPAQCIRIFLSVLDVHVIRGACHGRVRSITHKPGEFLNALKPEAAERNESLTLVLEHPAHRTPVAAIRMLTGAIARRIVCGAYESAVVQRGQRVGMIKFGSTAEVYLPDPDRVELQVREGQRVRAGASVVATVSSLSRPLADAPVPEQSREQTTDEELRPSSEQPS